MLLKALRAPATGRPGPLAQILAVLVVVGMLAISAPIAMPAVRWLLSLF